MQQFEPNQIRLERPDSKYKESYLAAMAELHTDSERAAWVYLAKDAPLDTPAKDFEAYVLKLRSTETEAPPNFVKNTCYWAIYDDEVIGRIAIRHELNDWLQRIGGHIGFVVRPSFRKMGVATEMLRLILQTERAKSTKRLLITCDEDNVASEKTIIKNGGVLEDIIPNGDKPRKKRFWIDLSTER